LSGNLLLVGYYRSSLRPDHPHPLGYGRELYFWNSVVALLLIALGAGLSIYEGITQITSGPYRRCPRELRRWALSHDYYNRNLGSNMQERHAFAQGTGSFPAAIPGLRGYDRR
jgi:divalent metal cation (Fe/Co/Zn/Cd) transporter